MYGWDGRQGEISLPVYMVCVALLNPGMNFLFGTALRTVPNKKFIPPISTAVCKSGLAI